MRKIIPLLVIAVCISILRLPSFFEPHWYDDEQIYLAIGKALNRGSQLYVDITDNKPPLLYWWVSLNPTLWWLKLSSTVFLILSTWYLYFVTRAYKFSVFARIASLSSFILITSIPRYEGNIFNAELMYMPLTLLAAYATWKRLMKPPQKVIHPLVIGLLVGVASLIKIPALAETVAILTAGVILSSSPIKQRAILMLQIVSGFLLPWLLISGYFLLQRSFDQFTYNAILYNFQYIGDWKEVSLSPLFQIVSPVSIRLLLLAGTLGATSLLYRFRVISESMTFTLMWLFCSWFGSLISLRPYTHYLLPLSVPVSLALGHLADAKIRQKLLLLVVVAAVYGYIQAVPFEQYRSREYYRNWWHYVTGQKSAVDYADWFNAKTTVAATVSQFLNSHAHRDETLFVWGNLAAVYAQTDLKTVSPYVTDYLVHSYSAYQTTAAALTASPPNWLVYCHAGNLSYPALNSLRNSSRYFLVSSTPLCDLHHLRPLPMLQ